MPEPQVRTGRLHLVMAVVAAAFLVMVAPLVVPVVMGALVAAAAHPLYVRLLARIRRPAAAAGLTTLVVGGGVVMPFAMVALAGIRATLEIVDGVIAFAKAQQGGDIAEGLMRQPWLARVLELLERYTPLSHGQMREYAFSAVQQVGAKLGQVLASSLQAAPQALMFLFIMVVAFYYLLLDGPRLAQWVVRQSPFSPERTRAVVEEVQRTAVATLLSSVAVAAAQSLLLFAGMLVAGVPGALSWLMVAFVSAFIPVVGTLPVSVGCAVYLALQGSYGGAAVMVVALLLAGVSDNLVRPWVIGGSSQQPPLVLLVSIFGGLWALGFPGLFIGPVLAALFLAMLDLYMQDLSSPQSL